MYNLNVENGKGTAKVFNLFKGCEMAVLSIQGERYFPHVNKDHMALEITYCLSGRAEFKMDDGCLQYVGEGDIFISTLKNHSDTIEYPLNMFESIILFFDLDSLGEDYIKILEKETFNIRKFFESLFVEDYCFFLQSRETTINFFADFTKIKEHRLKAYLTLKAYELLLLLENIEIKKIKQPKLYNNTLVNVVKNIEKHLKNNLEKRYTIKELSSLFHISETAIKTLFKEIYGSPISTYIKEYRIRNAKKLLSETNLNITEIAKRIGYNSVSKFGETFKKDTGFSPSEFRKHIK